LREEIAALHADRAVIFAAIIPSDTNRQVDYLAAMEQVANSVNNTTVRPGHEIRLVRTKSRIVIIIILCRVAGEGGTSSNVFVE